VTWELKIPPAPKILEIVQEGAGGGHFKGNELVKKYDYSILQGNKARKKERKWEICPGFLWSTIKYSACYFLKYIFMNKA
jgi:hypothetical protein